MKCLILCGGNGVIDPETKLRIPKCMLKIGNRPILWQVMKSYSNYGCTDFVLALGLGGDLIKDYFINSFELMHDIEVSLTHNEINKLNQIPEENWTIKLIDTGNSARTGARISRCERYLKFEPFYITYSDILSDVNLNELVNSHEKNKKMLTIVGANPHSRFGTFYYESNILTYEMHSKIRMENSSINGGFMIANDSIFKHLNPINECDLETEVIPDLISLNEINLYKHNGFWYNVDTERDLNCLQNLYSENKRPWLGIN